MVRFCRLWAISGTFGGNLGFYAGINVFFSGEAHLFHKCTIVED